VLMAIVVVLLPESVKSLCVSTCLQRLISLFSDNDAEVVLCCWKAVEALVAIIPKEEQVCVFVCVCVCMRVMCVVCMFMCLACVWCAGAGMCVCVVCMCAWHV